jgi:hypothetical protein
MMSEGVQTFSKRRVAWSVFALLVLFGLWYAFRPEKLFVNQKVNEAPPAGLTSMTPLYTGAFHADGHETKGRATVYQQPNGSRVLVLSNFSTSEGTALHVILLDGSSVANAQNFIPSNTNERDLGELKGTQSDQSYGLPADVDFDRFNTIAIYSSGLHAIFGSTKLDAF